MSDFGSSNPFADDDYVEPQPASTNEDKIVKNNKSNNTTTKPNDDFFGGGDFGGGENVFRDMEKVNEYDLEWYFSSSNISFSFSSNSLYE